MEDLHPGGRDRGQDPHRLLPAPQLHQDDGGRLRVCGQWISKKKVKVNIPARPFLGLSDEDMQEIKATTEEFIGRDD